jgi:hypothetical protein
MAKSEEKKPRSRKVKVEVSPDLEAIYSNFAVISHSASEIMIDFARILPNTPAARVRARIVTTPMNAKLLLRALKENLEKFETQYGEIRIPTAGTDLASQFFGEVKPPE